MSYKLFKHRLHWVGIFLREVIKLFKKTKYEEFISFPFSSTSHSYFNFRMGDESRNSGSLTRPFKEPFAKLRMTLPFLVKSTKAKGIFPNFNSETIIGKFIDVYSDDTLILSDGNLTLSPLLDFDTKAKNEQELSNLEVRISSETSDFEVLLNCNSLDGFLHLKVPTNERLRVASSEKIFISDIFNQKSTHEKDKSTLKILVIYIDAFSDPNFIDSNFLSLLMPNTHAYFNSALKFENHFASAEWTTPGFTSLITGKHSFEHDRIYSSDQIKTLETQIKPLADTIISDFREKDFFTGYFGGISHVNPALGYAHDFCRYLYMPESPASELISSFIEQDACTASMRTFNWLSFMDAHQVQHLSPKSRKKSNSLLRNFNFPSVRESMGLSGLTEEQFLDYCLRLFDLDAQLAILYAYLNRVENRNLITILTSDHGGAPLRNRQAESLNDERTRIPLYIKSPIMKNRVIRTYTSNKDFRAIINSVASEKILDQEQPFDSILKDDYIMIESRYIGKQYLCRVIDRLSGDYVNFKGGAVRANGVVDLNELQLTFSSKNLDLQKITAWTNNKFFSNIKFLNEINLK